MDDYIHFKTETNDNINDLNKNLNFDDKKVNNDKYILEKNKNILEKINSNNLHRKLALRNLIDKNDKYKDLYFLIYPMNKRKNEEKTINNKINLNLGIDLFKMRFKNSNNYLKNDNVIKWFKEMKITEEERMNSDNIRLTNLINENNNDSILNKNNSTYEITIDTYNNKNKKKEHSIILENNLFNNKKYYNNKFNKVNEFNGENKSLSKFEIDSWINNEKNNQNKKDFFLDTKKEGIKKLFSNRIFFGKNCLKKRNINYFNKTNSLQTNFACLSQLNKNKNESYSTNNSSKKHFFN
jgi:hypothetical protein